MSTITILGGSGFTGGWIAREAAARGHQVTTLSRTVPSDLPDGVDVQLGSATDDETVARAAAGADVVVAALSPRGEMAGAVRPAYKALAEHLRESGTRLIVIGGFGSLRDADGNRIADTPAFADDYRAEAQEMAGVLDDLQAGGGDFWTFVSPPAAYGSFIPDQSRRGAYRTGGTEPLETEDGPTTISGPDFALAIVDEIERAAHRGEHISVAY